MGHLQTGNNVSHSIMEALFTVHDITIEIVENCKYAGLYHTVKIVHSLHFKMQKLCLVCYRLYFRCVCYEFITWKLH